MVPPAPRCPWHILMTFLCIHSQHPGPVTFLFPLEWDNCTSGVFITPVQTLILMVLTCPCPGCSVLRLKGVFSSSLCPWYLSYSSAHNTSSINICRDICIVNLEKQSHEKPERCLQIFLHRRIKEVLDHMMTLRSSTG